MFSAASTEVWTFSSMILSMLTFFLELSTTDNVAINPAEDLVFNSLIPSLPHKAVWLLSFEVLSPARTPLLLVWTTDFCDKNPSTTKKNYAVIATDYNFFFPWRTFVLPLYFILKIITIVTWFLLMSCFTWLGNYEIATTFFYGEDPLWICNRDSWSHRTWC